jgi:hypothetical protein
MFGNFTYMDAVSTGNISLIHPHMHCHDFSEYARSQQWKIVFDKGRDGRLVVTATNNSYLCNVGDRIMAPDETVGFCMSECLLHAEMS